MENIKKKSKKIHTVKNYDAVKMMRDIRSEISAKTKNMTFEQFKKYINDKLKAK